MKRDGFTDPIIVWLGHGILIDGHNRHRVWRDELGGDEDKAPEMTEKHFATRDDVKEWMLRRQLSRRNLTDAMRVKIALMLKPMIAARAKENQRTAGGDKFSGEKPLVATLPEAVLTRNEIASAAGVSGRTVQKVETVLRRAADEIKSAMLSGKTTISSAYNTTVNATPRTKPKPAPEPQPNGERKMLGVGIERAHEAIAC